MGNMGLLFYWPFVGFTVLVFIIVWWPTNNINEKSATGFYLGGRALGTITSVWSLLITNLSTEISTTPWRNVVLARQLL